MKTPRPLRLVPMAALCLIVTNHGNSAAGQTPSTLDSPVASEPVASAPVTASAAPTPTTSAQPSSALGPLLLSDVLALSAANHPKLRGGEAERQAATAKRISKQGAFDTVAFSGSEFLRYNSTSTPGKPLTTTMNDAGLEFNFRNGMKIATGTRLNLGNPKSPESSTGNLGEFNIQVKMPLMRGAGINEKSTLERQALLGEPLAAANLQTLRLDVLGEAAFAYWTWTGETQKRTVAANLFRIAEIRAEAIQTRVDKGDLPGVDAIEARQEVQRRLGNLTKADRDVQKAAFKLAEYLWLTADQVQVPVPGQALERFPAITRISDAEADEAIALADTRRPEIGAVRLNRQIFREDERLASNDMRPSVDAVFNPGRDTGVRAIGETLKAGVLFTLPLQRREATGRRDEARLKQEKMRQEEVLVRQQIQLQVANAVNQANLTFDRYQAAVQEVKLARELEQKERQRFNLGEGTLFLVNQRERATAEAEQRLIDVQAEYHQARAALRQATGEL